MEARLAEARVRVRARARVLGACTGAMLCSAAGPHMIGLGLGLKEHPNPNPSSCIGSCLLTTRFHRHRCPYSGHMTHALWGRIIVTVWVTVWIRV